MTNRDDELGPVGNAVLIMVMIVFGLALVGGVIGGSGWAVANFNVYRQEKSGEATLKKAEHSRQITIVEAQAELDSAGLKAEADIIRAEGIAEANRIIGESITPGYVQWRWVEGLHDGTSEVIYIPTEANLPILEALRGVPGGGQ